MSYPSEFALLCCVEDVSSFLVSLQHFNISYSVNPADLIYSNARAIMYSLHLE